VTWAGGFPSLLRRWELSDAPPQSWASAGLRVRVPAAGDRALRRRITRFSAPEQGPVSGGL